LIKHEEEENVIPTIQAQRILKMFLYAVTSDVEGVCNGCLKTSGITQTKELGRK
jgi:hypothetical protein